ncbi:MAG: hypothetical protein J5967_01700 [Oscillospiraceae bacterium]|nr:hypothetical protein [Oscillospiraceae bacterium]
MNKQKKRPLPIVLVLCAVMVIAAVLMNAMLKDYEEKRSQPDNLVEPVAVDPYASPEEENAQPAVNTAPDEFAEPEEPAPAPEETGTPETRPAEHGYQVFKEDVSWTGAQKKCADLGGHLVVINDESELDEVIRLAEEAGISRVWIGCHRVNGEEIWETGEGIFRWAPGEPTYVDTNDRVAEDYIMLWDHSGWAYNDNRDDPCADYPEFYSGTMGYVCEFEAAG